MKDDAAKRKPGRPPSPETRGKALRAAREILRENGLAALTIEAVASRAGTGKPTLYRHWANALELAMEALMQEVIPALPSSVEHAPRAALIRQLDRMIEVLAPPRGTQIVRALAMCDDTSPMAARFRDHMLGQSRAAARETLTRFVASGKLDPPEDMEVVLDMLFAPLLCRVLAGTGPLDKALPAQLVDGALKTLDPVAQGEGYQR